MWVNTRACVWRSEDNFWRRFFFSILWVPGPYICRSLGLVARACAPWAILPALRCSRNHPIQHMAATAHEGTALSHLQPFSWGLFCLRLLAVKERAAKKKSVLSGLKFLIKVCQSNFVKKFQIIEAGEMAQRWTDLVPSTHVRCSWPLATAALAYETLPGLLEYLHSVCTPIQTTDT